MKLDNNVIRENLTSDLSRQGRRLVLKKINPKRSISTNVLPICDVPEPLEGCSLRHTPYPCSLASEGLSKQTLYPKGLGDGISYIGCCTRFCSLSLCLNSFCVSIFSFSIGLYVYLAFIPTN